MRRVVFGDQTVELVTHAERPDLEQQAQGDAFLNQWPQFMFHDQVANDRYPIMYDEWPEFQFYLIDGEETLVASGNCIPIAWDGTTGGLPEGWDDALTRATDDTASGRSVTSVCALQATASEHATGRGLGSALVMAMRTLATSRGLGHLIAPVRPSKKQNFPLIPIAEYARWQRPDGLPLDPWLRVHTRLGATMSTMAPESMRIEGTGTEWQEWTGVRFPGSGSYIIPGALTPVVYDNATDSGVYIEPNVWMIHQPAG